MRLLHFQDCDSQLGRLKDDIYLNILYLLLISYGTQQFKKGNHR